MNLTIQSDKNYQQTQVQVLDLMGRSLWTEMVDIFQGEQQVEIPTQNLGGGMYIVHVQHQGISQNLKLQIVK